jgi:hypothetical protein
MSDYLNQLAGTRRTIELCKADIRQLVPKARAAGNTWSEIGAALGMTKQGAVKVYGPKPERAAVVGQTTIDDV